MRHDDPPPAPTDLSNRERRFRTLIEHSSDIITVVEMDGTIVYESPAVQHWLGYTPEELLGVGAFDLIHPDDQPAVKAVFQDLLQRGDGTPAAAAPFRFRAKDRSWRWLESKATNLLHDPLVAGLVINSRDVTERIEMEAALRHRDEQYRLIVETASEGIWISDAEGRATFVNERLAHLLGFDCPEQLLGRHAREFFPPEEQTRLSDRLEQRKAGVAERYDTRCVRPDGSELWFMISAAPIRDAQGRHQGAIALITDITARKRAEQRNAAFQSLGQLLNAATTPEEAARVVLDVSDRLLGWDACWLELRDSTGRQARTVLVIDEVDGRRTEVPSPCPDPMQSPLARRALAEGPVLILRTPEECVPQQLPFGDTSRASASLLCVPIRSGERVIGVMSIQSYTFRAYDEEDLKTFHSLGDYCAAALERTVAEAARRELEQQLVQAQKMEAIGRLAGGVAHDFNNMLGVINGYCELLLDRPDTPPAHATPLREMRKAGERAAALTRQLLAFSRRQLIQPRVLSLAELVLDMHHLLDRLIGEDIRLVTHTDPVIGQVRADPSQLEQVLLNLVVNARDAMPQGGRLTLELRNVRVTERMAAERDGLRPGAYVCLSVADTGCGMDEETLAHVFEPFFTTKEVGQGTGLGLAMVYGAVQQCGGHVEVESERDRGTTFRIYLPRVDEPEAPPLAAAEEGQPSPSEATVLVVEDEAMLRGLICRVLTLSGCRVLEADHAEAALRRCEEHAGRIDLLLTDVVMPGRGGHELAAAVSKRCPEMKTLYMSGYTDDAVMRHGISADSVHFLQKPFTPATLLQKVREVLASPPG